MFSPGRLVWYPSLRPLTCVFTLTPSYSVFSSLTRVSLSPMRSISRPDQMRYMLSVAGNYNFLEFISNAKSGEFFFFSHDERFMIKTMKVKGKALARSIGWMCFVNEDKRWALVDP